jgi:hypothetical protein
MPKPGLESRANDAPCTAVLGGGARPPEVGDTAPWH